MALFYIWKYYGLIVSCAHLWGVPKLCTFKLLSFYWTTKLLCGYPCTAVVASRYVSKSLPGQTDRKTDKPTDCYNPLAAAHGTASG